MTNQETLKRAKAMDIDFGEGETLRGLLEGMERENEVYIRALTNIIRGSSDCLIEQNEVCVECAARLDEQNKTCQEYVFEFCIRQAESEIKKEK